MFNYYSSFDSRSESILFSFNNQIYSQRNCDLLNRENIILWDRKNNFLPSNYIDIKDVCNFYRIFQFKEIHDKWSDINIEQYNDYKKQIKSIIGSYKICNINPSVYDFIDLVPEKILNSFLVEQTKILNHLSEKLKEKFWFHNFFNFLKSDKCSTNVLTKLKYNINTTDGVRPVDLNFQSNFRFKSAPGTFSLFTLPKQDRGKVVPLDGHKLYCADFRQFEIRTFLRLCETDINFSKKEIYEDISKDLNLDKQTAKQQIIAYSYGQTNSKLEGFANKNNILNKINEEYFCYNEYPVILKQEDPDHIKIHTATQTISQYVFLQKLNKILELLDNRQSKFIFPLHDSVIVSIAPEEEYLIHDMYNILEDETYKIKQYIGKDFANLVEI